jgi:hypothetical protein
LGLLFWIPFLRKKNYLSFIHNIPLFVLPLVFVGKSIIRYGILEKDDIFNLLRIYAVSIVIYLAAIIILWVTKYLFFHLAPLKRHPV